MLSEESIARVLEHYDVGAVESCQCIPFGSVNDSWSVETTTGKYFLKGRAASSEKARLLAAQHALIEYLYNFGFPAPHIIRSRYDTTFLRLDDGIFELQDFIPGALYEASEPEHLTAAAQTLAAYHNAVEKFDHPDLHWPRERYGPTRLAQTIDQLLEDWQGRTNAQLAALVEELQEHAAELMARSAKLSLLPTLMIHGDYYAENLLIQDDTVVGVVDYDLAHWSQRSLELAEALIFFSTTPSPDFQHIVYSGTLDLASAGRFLGTYSGGRYISEPEIRMLPHLIRTIWLCAALDPPLEPRLSIDVAPYALPEILALASWARAHAEDIIEIGLAAQG